MNLKNVAEHENSDIWVTLSRRNLETLLKMLDHRTSGTTLHRSLDNGVGLHIQAEENEAHYASEHREPIVRGIHGIGPEHIQESEPVSKFVSNARKSTKDCVNGLVPLPEAA